MGKTLQLTFLTGGDKKVTLTVDEPKTDLTKEEVEAAMDEIIEARWIVNTKSNKYYKVINRNSTGLL